MLGFSEIDSNDIEDAAIVAPWHQHGPRGMYDDPGFKGSHNFMLMSSIAKHLGLKFDAFGGKLMRRDDNTVVGRTRQEVAKILLGLIITISVYFYCINGDTIFLSNL